MDLIQNRTTLQPDQYLKSFRERILVFRIIFNHYFEIKRYSQIKISEGDSGLKKIIIK